MFAQIKDVELFEEMSKYNRASQEIIYVITRYLVNNRKNNTNDINSVNTVISNIIKLYSK